MKNTAGKFTNTSQSSQKSKYYLVWVVYGDLTRLKTAENLHLAGSIAPNLS